MLHIKLKYNLQVQYMFPFISVKLLKVKGKNDVVWL